MLPYLQSHDAYGVDECLQHCLEHGVQVRLAVGVSSEKVAGREPRVALKSKQSELPSGGHLTSLALHLPPTALGQDGAAFLLERRGDVHSALNIYIQTLDKANRQLVAAVRGGPLALAAAAAAAVAAEADGRSAGSLAAPAQLATSAPLVRSRRLSLLRGGGSYRAGAAAAAAAALLAGPGGLPLPRELQAARDASASAVAMCLRQAHS